MAFERHIKDQAQDKPWLGEKADKRRVTDLVETWFNAHGVTLSDGLKRKGAMEFACFAMGNPLATEFNAKLFATYREQRLSGVFGSGLNSIAGADHSMVVAALNETKKGIGDTLKEWIRKVVEFFKGIGKAVTKWLSGSSKLKGRADEILKRAGGQLKNDSVSGKNVQLTNPGALAIGQVKSNKGMISGVEALAGIGSETL